jgi:solute carrier family 45 protein 1/2/4
VIGFSADAGYLLGDKLVDDGRPRFWACTVFIVGFWILDLANNAVQVNPLELNDLSNEISR